MRSLLHLLSLPLIIHRAVALLSALTVFTLLFAMGEVALHARLQERANQRHIAALSYAATLRVRLGSELNAQLNLNSGLAAYLVVRNNSLDRGEVQAILAELHRQSRHVRNFGVAVGYYLRYVYPLAGNERVVNLYYPSLPDQWPLIEQIVKGGRAALAGPVNLAQGGLGLIYRTPIMLSGPDGKQRYWGLLSTVLDSDSFFKAVQAEAADPRYEFAIRGRDVRGLEGGPVWGDQTLFGQTDRLVQVQEMDVPGGRWAIVVSEVQAEDLSGTRWRMRGVFFFFSALIATLLYMLIRSRGLMAQRALHDSLTGLPNRRLFEDRALMAFSRRQRQPDLLCALLFLDLDDFKIINDRHGHKAGDAVLREVAQRAQAAVRQNDTVARWGGDEFIVLLEHASPDMLAAIATRLRGSIQAPIEYQGCVLNVGVSIGVARYPDDGANLDQLLHAADHQMYSDKSGRKAGDSRSLAD